MKSIEMWLYYVPKYSYMTSGILNNQIPTSIKDFKLPKFYTTYVTYEQYEAMKDTELTEVEALKQCIKDTTRELSNIKQICIADDDVQADFDRQLAYVLYPQFWEILLDKYSDTHPELFI